MRRLTTILTLLTTLTTFGQDINSLVNQKPQETILTDTIIIGRTYNRIDMNGQGLLMATGNIKEDGTKHGRWTWYDSKGHPLCSGEYNNGTMTGWWTQHKDLCSIKYKKGIAGKRRCKF